MPPDLELHNDQFFLSMDQSLIFGGISLLQSSRKNDILMNATDNHECVFDSTYDESNVDDFDEVDGITYMKISFSVESTIKATCHF